MIERLGRALSRPVDIAWLAAFRVLFGLTMCVSALRFLAYGWVDEFFVTPTFHFKYWGFGWVEPLPAPFMHALFWLIAASALLISLGLLFRVAAWLFVVAFTYVGLIDVATYLNHYYLASLLALLLALSPANRAFSLDARLFPTRATAVVPSGWLYLFRFQVGIVYTCAGLAKLTSDWLIHAQPLRIWLASRTDLPVLGPLFSHEWAAPLMSWGGFLFDLTIAWWLLFRRTRPFAFAAVIGFHAVTRLLFPIGMFPFIMVLSALMFFSPSWPRILLRRAVPALPSSAPAPPSRRARFAVAAAFAFVGLQLVMPVRYLAYGGDVLWHEQGMRFSWRVMVREKNGSITYVVRQKATGKIWHVAPRAYLTRPQERELSGQPDLILQLAHHIHEDFARRGLGDTEVRVEALVSLNGRRIAPLIDPDVDLARIEDGIGRAAWVLPAPETAPPEIRPVASRRGS